jgi:hypothetical protein
MHDRAAVTGISAAVLTAQWPAVGVAGVLVHLLERLPAKAGPGEQDRTFVAGVALPGDMAAFLEASHLRWCQLFGGYENTMVTTEATLNHRRHGTDDHVHRLGEVTSRREAAIGFAVARVRIVGTGTHSAERVAGRLAKARATLIGTGLGAWQGLVTGLVTGLPLALSGAGLVWLTAILCGPLIGAAFGAALGLITHWATDGRGDSASTTDRQARRYAVEADSAHATEDVQALDRSRLAAGWGHHPVRYQLGYVRRRSGQDQVRVRR